MLQRFLCGGIHDPIQGRRGEGMDLWARDGIMISSPVSGSSVCESSADETIDLSNCIVMPGAIDIHTHIGGGKLTIARTLLPERYGTRNSIPDAPFPLPGNYLPNAWDTGIAYARLGYTACFEPAMLFSGARQAHLEMAEIPIIDHGGYVVMGNEEYLLRRLQEGADASEIADYVAWTMNASGALAVKVVNPGGIDAFKFGAQRLDVDENHPQFGVTPRQVITALTTALDQLGVPHPLHVHCGNLGIPGNWDSTLRTASAAEGRPIHLTHVQFHSYGDEGPRKFSTQAAKIAEFVNRHPNVSVDIGQVIFGQTVTVSADIMHQSSSRKRAQPKKWVCSTIECQSGCGVVPFRYRDTNFVHALQWAIGLELLLLVEDPWRVFLTTDHPNGGPFTAYPYLIRMLMDRTYREEQLRRIHPDAIASSNLRGIQREYTLDEIAIMTRAAPARILGLRDLGHLGPGAAADLVAYRKDLAPSRIFAEPHCVYRRGRQVVERDRVVATPPGRAHRVNPAITSHPEKRLEGYFASELGIRLSSTVISPQELLDIKQGHVVTHPCEAIQRREQP